MAGSAADPCFRKASAASSVSAATWCPTSRCPRRLLRLQRGATPCTSHPITVVTGAASPVPTTQLPCGPSQPCSKSPTAPSLASSEPLRCRSAVDGSVRAAHSPKTHLEVKMRIAGRGREISAEYLLFGGRALPPASLRAVRSSDSDKGFIIRLGSVGPAATTDSVRKQT